MKTLTDIMNELSAEQQAKINARAETLIAEETILRDLHKAQNLTQTQKKYDFADLVGRLKWDGDALAEQQRLRNEF